MSQVKLTTKAVEKIKQIMVEQGSTDETSLRVGIKGKSCSGPVYSFSLDEEYHTFYDDIIEQDGLRIVHNKQFVDDLDGIVIDYLETEDKRGFAFKNENPFNIITTGGCGSCGSGCGL